MRCPILAFFARVGTMLPTRRFSPLHLNPVVHTFVVPALRKVREGLGTHDVAAVGEVKSPATRPAPGKTGGWTQSVLGKLATRAGSRSRGRTCATNGPRGDLPPSVHPAPCVRKNRCFVGGMAIGSDNKSGNGSHNCKVAVDPRGDSVQGILTIKMNIIQPLRPC